MFAWTLDFGFHTAACRGVEQSLTLLLQKSALVGGQSTAGSTPWTMAHSDPIRRSLQTGPQECGGRASQSQEYLRHEC
eukprot:5664816-Amphidinium_carterae.1